MSKFVSNELITIDLGDEEWVKIPKEISFEDCQGFSDAGIEGFEQSLNLLKKFIREWNLKDDSGNPVELTVDNIKKLKIEIINEIQSHLVKLVSAVSANVAAKKKELAN